MARDFVRLLLAEPDRGVGSEEAGEMRKKWVQNLENLESKISPLILSSGRSEAKLWLSNAVSGITGVSSRKKKDSLLTMLRKEPRNRSLAGQLLRLIFEGRPEKAGSILQPRGHLLERFFDGHPKRIAEWFSHFSIDERGEHKRGARALSQFAFSNRDICWEELDWKGKHGQSPVVVASKPYYLLDLDIQKTIQNFIDNVPEFWSSAEFSQSLKDGDIISIDTNFFQDFFQELMYSEGSEDIWRVIGEFLQEAKFSMLCRHLLITLDERELCTFLNTLNLKMEGGTWFEFACRKKIDEIDELLVLNAVINEGHKLLKMVGEEDCKNDINEEISKVQRIAENIGPLLVECSKMNTVKAMKLLGIQSWAIFCVLSETPLPAELWEGVFSMNGIKFEKSKEYSIIEDGSSEDEINRKTKRRKNECREFIGDELVLNKRERTWLLSTDQFSTSWPSADLPEHLSKYCFNLWMKWLQT